MPIENKHCLIKCCSRKDKIIAWQSGGCSSMRECEIEFLLCFLAQNPISKAFRKVDNWQWGISIAYSSIDLVNI